VVDGRTQTELRELTGQDRSRELAAMLGGGAAGNEAHAAAEALLRSAGV
jgi:DNA repair ATPase RecN